MKLKAQITEELLAANKKRREVYKAAQDDSKAHEDTIYYEGICNALNWVLESREEFRHCV